MALDDATQDIAERLGRAVLIFDTDLNVLAYSIHEGVVDRGRLEIILARRATPIAAQMISDSNAKHAIGPIFLPHHEDVTARILMPLRHNGLLQGYLSYSEPNAQEDSVPAALPLLTEASTHLGALVALHHVDRHHDNKLVQQLIGELLSPHQLARKSAALELTSRKLISESEQYAVMVFRGHGDAQRSSSPTTRLAVEETLSLAMTSSTLRGVGATVDGDGVVVIPRPVNRDRLARVLEKPSLAAVTAGVGTPRSQLHEIVESHREARIAWQATRRLPTVYGQVAHWDEMGLDRILLQLPLGTLRREDLPANILRVLDARSGFDLARTLDSYLNCGGDVRLTANTLHIHRSTLYYRLDRLRELIEADLADGVVRRDLHTSLHLARLAGFWSG